MQIKFVFSQTNSAHKGRGACFQDHKFITRGISLSYLNPFCPSASLCCGWSTVQVHGPLVGTTGVTLLSMGCSGPGVGFRKKGTTIYPVYGLTDFLWGNSTCITCSTQENTLVCIFAIVMLHIMEVRRILCEGDDKGKKEGNNIQHFPEYVPIRCLIS